MALKANANSINVSNGRSNGGTVFWGENIRGGLKSRNFGTQLWKSLRAENGVKKINPGVAYSVLTPDIDKETMKFQAPILRLHKQIQKMLLPSYWVAVLGHASFLLLAKEPSQQ